MSSSGNNCHTVLKEESHIAYHKSNNRVRQCQEDNNSLTELRYRVAGLGPKLALKKNVNNKGKTITHIFNLILPSFLFLLLKDSKTARSQDVKSMRLTTSTYHSSLDTPGQIPI